MDNCNCNPGGKTMLTKDITKEIQKVIDENGKLRDQVRELVDIIKRYGLGNDLNFKCCCQGNGNINASDLVLIKEVRIEDGNLVITFNTQEGDQVVTYSIFDLFNPANYYTKLEVENKILEMLESAGVGTNVSDIYEINYVVPSVNDLPNNADPMEIALVNNELEGTLALYRKLTGASWTETVPEGNYIYDNKVYKYTDGSVSIGVNEIIKRSNIPYAEGGTVPVSRWASAIADGTTAGQYGYNTQLKKLYKWDGSNWSEVQARTNIIYINIQTNKQYRWNGSDMVELSGGAGTQDIYFTNGNYSSYNTEDPSETTNGKFNTNDNGQEAKEIDLSPLFAGIEDEIDNINKEEYRKNMDEENELLYPEYWYVQGESDRRYAARVKAWKLNYEAEHPTATNSQINSAFDSSTNDELRQAYRQLSDAEAAEYCENNPIVYSKNYYDWNIVKYNCETSIIISTATALLSEYEEDLDSKGTALESVAEGTDEYTAIQRYITILQNKIAMLEDDISNSSARLENIQDYIDIEVKHPTEQLADTTSWYNSEFGTVTVATGVTAKEVDVRDVYFDDTLNRFILKVTTTQDGVSATKYYRSWKNSYLWQKEDGSLRTDTVYSRVTLGAFDSIIANYKGTENKELGSLYKTVTWIVKDGTRTDIFTAFTDFSYAIKRAILENNGKCRLHSTKIYGMSSGVSLDSTMITSLDINGQGGIICRIPSLTLQEQRYYEIKANNVAIVRPKGALLVANSCFSIKNITDISISNVKLFATRTAIRNSASHLPPSYSNSGAYGISINSENNVISDVRIKSVEYKGCAYDLRVSGTYRYRKVIIEDWKSNETNGCFLGGIDSLIIDRADLIQGEYSSKHIIYCGSVGCAQAHLVKNSRFIQNSVFNSNFIQYKNETTDIKRYSGDSSGTDYIVAHLTFYNCHMRVGRGMEIISPYNDFHLCLDNCTIHQHDKFVLYGGRETVGYWGGSAIINMAHNHMGIIHFNNRANLKIKDTVFKVWNRPVYIAVPSSSYNSSPATPTFINVETENVQVLLNDVVNYTSKHIAATSSEAYLSKLLLVPATTYTKGKPVVKTVNAITNYVPSSGTPFLTDNSTSMAKASGSDTDFRNREVGFCYFNTTAGKPLWIGSIALDGTYNWVDADGTPYTTNGQQANI